MRIIRVILCCFAAISFCLGSLNVIAKETGSEPAKKSEIVNASIYPININKADAETLEEIKGIGSSKAKAIILYRDEHGVFTSIDDLTNVKGIGQKFLEKIKDQISVG